MAVNKWAVLIGVFLPGITGKQGADRDAKDMASVLQQKYGFPKGNIKLLVQNKGTYKNIMEAIGWLKTNEGPSDTVVFLWCAHGGHGFIGTYDNYCVSGENLKAALAGIESTKFLLWFGSCMSGSLIPPLAGNGRVIVTAVADGEYAGVGFKNTVFGENFIVKAMKEGLGDLNADGVVSVEEAYQYAARMSSCGHPQISDGYEGEMAL